MRIELFHDPGAQTVALRLSADASPADAGAAPVPALSREQVLAALAEAGYGDWRVDEAALAEALSRQGGAAPEAGAAPPGFVVIAERRDAEARVVVSEDLLSASLEVVAAHGGTAASIEGVLRALTVARVVHGVSLDAIEALLRQSDGAPPGALISGVIARGTAGVDGQDARFDCLVPTAQDRVFKPREGSGGRADLYDLGDIPTVAPGTPLMRRFPATSGRNGRAVTGQVLLAKAGRSWEFDLGAGVRVCPTDPNLLEALDIGMPARSEHGMRVDPVYCADRVDVSTGNIVFPGSVYIKGDVAMGMRVQAEGDITVTGSVAAASLSAQGDVIVGQGISGGVSAKGAVSNARIEARGTCWAGFAQCADIQAGGDVVIDKFVMHCRITTQGGVHVGGAAPGNGKLIGGEIRAERYAKADFLGAENGAHTYVEIAGNLAAIQAALKACVLTIRQHTVRRDEIAEARENLLKKYLGKPLPALIDRIDSLQKDIEKELTAAEARRAGLERDSQAVQAEARLVLTRKAFPGAEIVIGGQRLLLIRELGPCTIYHDVPTPKIVSGELRLAEVQGRGK